MSMQLNRYFTEQCMQARTGWAEMQPAWRWLWGGNRPAAVAATAEGQQARALKMMLFSPEIARTASCKAPQV